VNVVHSENNLYGGSAEHIVWADLCRAVAIYGIILIHSCGAAFYQYGKIPLSDWLAANFLDSLVRCTVPLFVMLSGTLNLRHEGGSLQKVRHRIIRVLLPLLVWSGIYLMYVSHNSGLRVDWLSVFSKEAMYHLWFVYMIIGIYLFLPLFQTLFDAIRSRLDFQIYFFSLWFVISCIPVYWPLPLLSLLQQNSFFGFGGYFLIGGIVASTNRDRISTLTWSLLFLLGVLTTFGITWYLSWQAEAPVVKGYLYLSPNVLISSIAAFVLFTRIRLSVATAKLMKFISERCFFIFFVHVLVLEYVRYSDFIASVNQHAPMFITIIVISTITFVTSLMMSSFVKLIPGAQRFLG